MRNKFEWYINPSVEEIDHIWKNGILTLDTNVLLDLYRYHEDTRNSLIQSLQKFEGKKWLSHQAAIEFFRNRTKVIVSSEKAFKEARDEAEKLSDSLDTAISKLKGNRIIPSSLVSDFETGVRPLVSSMLKSIDKAQECYPKFLLDDPILEQLLVLFDGSVGKDFEEKDKEEIEKEAERRKQGEIPPGYLDDGKDEDRPYGDYYLWRQIITHAKIENCPIILVTSERKEDWWERISGKTTGPRPELMKEAKGFSGNRVLIYQTERFLEFALQRFQQPINEDAIEEIRAVGAWRAELEAAVKLHHQVVSESTAIINNGTLKVELKRPVRNFTVSGRLDPNMQDVPELNVQLLSSPEFLPKHMIKSGTGTTHDFNIHILSGEPDTVLPVGLYLFEYEAKSLSSFEDLESVKSKEV